MPDDISPFQIAVPDAAIAQLWAKLAAASFADRVEFSDDGNYGAPLSDVQRLAQRWGDGFDWRAQEAALNKLPQFTTPVEVDGFGTLNIHFLHQRSSNANSIPLLFVHGWPGSFLEVVKLLPLLTSSESSPSFHIVAPSLPNFGFSDVVTKPGFSITQYAETVHKLMVKLGYTEYVTQGGDWGFMITRLVGANYPDHCLASHVNFVRIHNPPTFSQSPLLYLQSALTPYTSADKAGLARSAWFRTEGFGYNATQSTKPSTLGFALADSPVALLAWIYEKLRDWTDDYAWADDEILTWVSLYQFSRAGPAASVRIYYETKHAAADEYAQGLCYVPRVKLGVSLFPRDVVVPPQRWAHSLGPVVFAAVHDKGGHFAAHERPEQLALDLRSMFGAAGGAGDVAKRFDPVL
ncbi:epoxide hydrolase 1 [Cordyceps militaris CM01]|uniref:Epoxide hydrolase 1 n=1 Tax=Cordyceps militaris (strain CM01) TaxID=983644 RepID=G3JH24_CORMM|nr:epoxide hydrolase 1 [Cordyceps militaris CM01]EGX91580.1 epoxide hydrolase 1 [Cordyceps militaris CM01]